MSLMGVGGTITNIVGIGIVGGVAVKTIDMVGNMSNNTKKKKKGKNRGIFDMDMDMDMGYGGYGGEKTKKGKRKSMGMDDMFGGQYY